MIDHPSPWIVGAALVGGGFIIWRHRGNLARLRAGTENKL
jgi:glycerol-3-phosphate acyltransferase PlsY